MEIRKPLPLIQGDTLGVVAPSRNTYGTTQALTKSFKLLKRFGFQVKPGNSLSKKCNSNAGTIQERVRDIHQMFENQKIKAIFCALGGDSSNQLIDQLDYPLIAANPKIFVGYSDITHLLLAIHRQTGLVTYHGPNLNILSHLTKSSVTQMMQVLTAATTTLNCWEDVSVYKPGRTTGKLIGGNLFVVNCLLKTDYMPDLTGAILFWEDINEGLGSIEFQLYQLKLSGILEKISGMVIGHIHYPSSEATKPLKELIDEITKPYTFPIIKVNYFGHFIKKFYTLPLGSVATLDTFSKTFTIKV